MSMVTVHENAPVHVHYVLHDGNDATFYGILTNAVPKGACKYGDPVFHADGTLEFPNFQWTCRRRSMDSCG